MSTNLREYPGQAFDNDTEQIRILKLLPGSDNDPIHCTLQNVPLEQVSNVEALSYTWGLPPASHNIWVNDFEFVVRTNLYNALLNLRLPDVERPLWVDAVCINQLNVQERNHQVQQMARIFSTAKTVIVWLGLSTTYTQSAFDFLKECYLGGHASRKMYTEDPRWCAVDLLCQNDYWQRVWVVQEICLGQNIVILSGQFRIPWQYVSELRKARKHVWPQYQSSGERRFMRSLLAKIDHQRDLRASQGCALWTLMESFADSLCQEYHDKVYGFMGLSTDCGGAGLAVDYTKSLEELHRDVIFLYRRILGKGLRRDTPQLLSLSESLQKLLAESKLMSAEAAKKTSSSEDEVDSEVAASTSPTGLDVFAISTKSVYTIIKSGYIAADKYEMKLVEEFLEDKTPYSHIGHWRNQLDPHLHVVQAFEGANAFIGGSDSAQPHTMKPRSTLSTDSTRPALVTAKLKASLVESALDLVPVVVPSICGIGDVILTFVGCQIALVFNHVATTDSKITMSDFGYVKGCGSFKHIIGRACILQVAAPRNRHMGTMHLGRNKEIEYSRQSSTTAEHTPETIAQETMFIDSRTLYEVTATKTAIDRVGFAGNALNLMPTTGNTHTQSPGIASIEAERLGKELDLEQIRADPWLQRYTIGPGYAPIENPASLGYMCCMLQLFFILQPIRTAILDAAPLETDSAVIKALRDLFWHLRYRSLPVSPLPLTEAFGWKGYQIHEQQDLFEFYRVFSAKLEKDLGSVVIACTKGQYKTTNHDPEYGDSSRIEEFYDFQFNPDSHYLLECMQDDLLHDPDKKTMKLLTQLPDVFFMQIKFYKYDFKQDKMTTWDGNFEYPAVIDLESICDYYVEDTEYQLHAVCVLENVKPVPRYLLYIRPRPEEQWLLHFKESVTYARLSEVFEDNFRRPGYPMPENAPLRTPYLLLYIKKSKVRMYLDDAL